MNSFARAAAKKYNVEGLDSFMLPCAVGPLSRRYKGASALLTEQEVSRSWSQVFKGSQIESASFERAEQLLEELRPESPLRLRLTLELEELRSMHASPPTVAARR